MKEIKKRVITSADYIALGIIILFLTFELISIKQYGITVDEGVSMQRGIGTLNFLTQILSGKWDVKPLEQDWGIFHPVFFPTIHYLMYKSSNNLLGDIPSRHLPIVIISSIGLFFLYLLAKKMFNEKIGLYSLILMILFPRFLAHSQYNPKDIPIMVFSIIAFYFLYVAFFYKKNTKYAIISGVFIGIAASTKLDGLLILPIFFLPFLIYSLFINKEKSKGILKLALIALSAGLILIILLWPKLWTNLLFILDIIKSYSEEFIDLKMLHLGTVYLGNEVPWHYYPINILIATPIITIILFLIGIYISSKKLIKKGHAFEILFLFFWLLVPLIIRIFPGSVKYDGIRHVFLAIPALIILAGIGLDSIIKSLEKKHKKHIIGIFLMIIIILLVKEVAIIHPFEGSYFNEAVRVMIPKNIENYFFMGDWGAAYLQGTNWINENAKENSKVCIYTFSNLMSSYSLREDLKFDCNNADYLLTSTSYDYYGHPNYRVIYKIEKYNSEIMRIYERQDNLLE